MVGVGNNVQAILSFQSYEGDKSKRNQKQPCRNVNRVVYETIDWLPHRRLKLVVAPLEPALQHRVVGQGQHQPLQAAKRMFVGHHANAQTSGGRLTRDGMMPGVYVENEAAIRAFRNIYVHNDANLCAAPHASPKSWPE